MSESIFIFFNEQLTKRLVVLCFDETVDVSWLKVGLIFFVGAKTS